MKGKKLLFTCCSGVLALCSLGLAGMLAGAEEAAGKRATPSAAANIFYEMAASDAVSEAGIVLDESVNVSNMKLNTERGELNIAGDFEGWVAYNFQMDQGYVVETLTLDWTGRLACYLDSSTTKLVISVSADGGAYTEVSSTDGTASALESGQETLTEVVKGAGMVTVKFDIIWTGLDSRDWMGIGTVRLTGTGRESEVTQKAYSFTDDYTQQAADREVTSKADGKDEIVAAEHMMYRSSDGKMHLQITNGMSSDMTGYVVYRLAAGKNYGFKSLNLSVIADRISNFEATGTITINIYAKDETAENWGRVGEPIVADGTKTNLSYDLTDAVKGATNVLVKYEIVYESMATYSHDWVRLDSMSFTGMVDLVPVEYSFKDDYAEYEAEETIETAEEQTLLLRTNDEEPPRVCLQRPTDAQKTTGYIVYKREVPNGGVFNTMSLTINGRFLHAMDVSSGSITVNVYVKGEGEEYVKAFARVYQNCNESVLAADLTENAKDKSIVYIKIEIVDDSGVSFSHDWVRFDDVEISGTQSFVPYDDDGVERYTITYLKGADDVVGKTPVQKEPLKEGDELALPENPFLRSGYRFGGWKADTDDTVYQAGDTYAMTASAVNFTAVWERMEYALSYESGLPEDAELEGTLPASENYYMGDEVTFPQPAISAAGYKFAGYVVCADEFNRLLFVPGEVYVMKDGAATVTYRWVAENYEGPVIDTSDEKYDFMGEFAANINFKNTELETDAYEIYNVITRTNDEGSATGAQLPQASSTSQGYVTWALYAGDNKTFEELYFKFSGRVAVYESVNRASKAEIFVSEDNADWMLKETFTGSESPLSEYSVDLSDYAAGKATVYVKVLISVEDFPSYGAEWVQITAVEFSGISETASNVPVDNSSDSESSMPSGSGSSGANDSGSTDSSVDSGCGSTAGGAAVLTIGVLGGIAAILKKKKSE